MDFDKLFPNRFLKATDFDGKDVTLTIGAVKLETLEGARKEIKGIITFSDHAKEYALNKTNGVCLKAMFGRETAAWVGKRVTFFPAANNTGMGDSNVMVRLRGSPDIAADITFTWKPARRAEQTFTMKKTGTSPAAKASPPKVPTPHFDALMALATLNQVPAEKVKAWLKANGCAKPSQVMAEHVEAYRAQLAAEAPPIPEEAF